VNDVAVGEVWVASGQSNMAYRLLNDANAAAAVAASADPQLRFFTVGGNATDTPLTDVSSKWIAADPQTSAGFSAVAYYFARDLRKTPEKSSRLSPARRISVRLADILSAAAFHFEKHQCSNISAF